MNTELIYESDGLEVFFHKGDSRFCLVTFNNFATLANGINFWGESFVRALRINCLSFMQKQRNWFPLSEMDLAINSVEKYILNFDLIFSYGNSMGGYAALKYACRLGASYVFAFNPQCSINPIDVPFEDRFNSYFDPARNSMMKIDESDFPDNSYVFFDPHRYDDSCHARILGGGGAKLVMVPYTDHMTIRIMNSSRIAELLDFAVNKVDIPVKKINAWKKDFPLYRLYLAIALINKGHEAFGERIIRALGGNSDPVSKAEACRVLSSRGMARFCDLLSC